jgi:Leu/Phe-tRNA-protein transferase
MNEVWYYKGVHKVKVVTESKGYWIVEALEEFDDDADGEKVTVKAGEQRIVPSDSLHKHKYLAPPIKEHEYELKMEKKVKQLIAEEEKKHVEKE